jgi:ribosome-binding protein aMBF1 (putative translation factor)
LTNCLALSIIQNIANYTILRRKIVRKTVNEFIGSKVKEGRVKDKISLENFSEKFGVSVAQMRRYEMGTAIIHASHLYTLSKILKVPVGYFYEGYDNQNAGVECHSFRA